MKTSRSCGTAVAACVALGIGFGTPSCGVIPSSDCTEKATCADDAGDDEGSPPEADVVDVADAPVEDDGAPDGAGFADAGDAADAMTRDVVSEPDATDASVDVTDGANTDAPSEAALAPDTGAGCGAIDCSNASCTAYTCVPSVPAGWTGPALLWRGAFGSPPPTCPAGYRDDLDAFATPTGSAATCACSCTASGRTCSTTGTFQADQGCRNSPCATVAPATDGTCTAVPANACGNSGSFTIGGGAVPTPTGGTCSAQVTTTPGSTPGWGTSARVCRWTSAGTGCTGTNACVAAPPAAFAVCVYQAGSATCPAAYPNVTTLFSAETDGRRCGPCTCSGPSGGTCSGTVSVWGTTAGGCTGAPGSTYTLGSTCRSYANVDNVPGYVQASVAVTGSSCSVAVAPQPLGAVTGTGPTTVCCM